MISNQQCWCFTCPLLQQTTRWTLLFLRARTEMHRRTVNASQRRARVSKSLLTSSALQSECGHIWATEPSTHTHTYHYVTISNVTSHTHTRCWLDPSCWLSSSGRRFWSQAAFKPANGSHPELQPRTPEYTATFVKCNLSVSVTPPWIMGKF